MFQASCFPKEEITMQKTMIYLDPRDAQRTPALYGAGREGIDGRLIRRAVTDYLKRHPRKAVRR